MTFSVSRETTSDSLTQSLDLLSDTYNYNLWVYSLLRPHVGENVLEVGAGVGNLTRFLLPHARIVCLEPDPQYAAALKQLSTVHHNLEVVQTTIQDQRATQSLSRAFDTVLCVNVLEHIEDDVSAVRAMLSCLRVGGKLLLYVPACPFAFGVLDTELGHYQRYSRKELHRIVTVAGGRLLLSRYINMPGVFGWFWASRVSGEKRIDPRKARFVDALAPYISAVERLIPPPIGQSLFAVIVT